MPDKRLSNYLRTYRKRARLSQKTVARLCGRRSGSFVSRYESGKRPVPLEIAMAFSVIYGVDIRELFAGRFAQVESEVMSRRVEIERLAFLASKLSRQ
jgi:transcriptional regulator with XRE-family HTH domain